MKKWIWVIALLFSTVCFAGERNMIRNFDKNGLKDLNNQLKKQEKLIKKLQKQLGQSGASTTAVQSTEDFVSETVLDNAGTVINTVPAVGVAREDGRLELYDTSIDEATVINIEPSSYVHETQAKIAVPSSYYMDLRSTLNGSNNKVITADFLTLHDSSTPISTVGLSNVNETNVIIGTQTISEAGKRDQADAFADEWIHYFIIYNPVTGDVSSLSSLSATAPTLPSGYTHFVKVSSDYITVNPAITTQINDKHWFETSFSLTGNNNSYNSLDISSAIPATAKMVFGQFGMRGDPAAPRTMGIASDSAHTVEYEQNFLTGEASAGNPRTQYFELPLLTAQTLYWYGEGTAAEFVIIVKGYVDDL